MFQKVNGKNKKNQNKKFTFYEKQVIIRESLGKLTKNQINLRKGESVL